MKIFKPDALALLYRSFRFAQTNSLALGMMACFHVDRSSLPELLSEQDMWAAVAQALGTEAILDEGLPKPVGEFKVYGAACAPGGTPVAQQAVGVRVGSLAKSLIVSGDRHFNAAGLISQAIPYARMPIAPQTAFGGLGFAKNPLGKGYAKLEDGAGGSILPLPNVETAQHRIANRGDHADPAGFWGFDAASPQRQQYLGRCDDRWLKRDWPHLPDDTRPEFFQTAPVDQHLPAWFVGNEALEMRNLHPQRSVIESHLPKLRARCFINRRRADRSTEFSEIEARAETVWLFPELECGIVLYRALASVSDDSAEDVLHVMAQWEAMDTAPLSFDYYHGEFLAKLPAPIAAAQVVPPAQGPSAPVAVPAVPAAAISAQASPETAAVMTPELAEVDRMAADLERQTQALMGKHGVKEQDVARFLAPEAPRRVLSLPEVEKMAQDLELQTRELMQRHKILDKDLAPFLTQNAEKPAPTMAEIRGLLQDVERATQDAMRKAGISEQEVYARLAAQPDMAQTLKNLQALGPDPVPLLADLPAPAVSALPAVGAFDASAVAAIAPTFAPTFAAPTLAAPSAAAMPQHKLTREDVIERHGAKESLGGYDLSALDLAGLDLSGANFSDALLEKTRFVGSKLTGANFTKALLQDADFNGADLERAQLTKVSAGAAKCAKANLQGAQLNDADFTKADFSGARLDGANLCGAVFDGAGMAGVAAVACKADRVSFTGCDLTGANFSRAALTQANFGASQLADSNFSGAMCDQAEFYGAQAQNAIFADASLRASRADSGTCFDRAQFPRAQIGRANWDGVQLRGALLDGAVIDDADFSNVKAGSATFRQVSAKGAKFAQADLNRADLSAINLFKGSLRKTNMDGTVMRKANLYGVDFEGTQPTIASLEGSNIERTILQYRPPVI